MWVQDKLPTVWPLPSCPACGEGRHTSCDRNVWDDQSWSLVDCPCAVKRHE